MRDAAVVTAGLSVAACFPDVGGRWPRERAGCRLSDALVAAVAPGVVAEVHDEGSVIVDPVTSEATINAALIPTMLDDALRSLAGDTDDYWPVLLPDYAPGMRIGLKINVLNPQCPTSLPVIQAVLASLMAPPLSVPSTDLLVWDRRLDELKRSGYAQETLGVPVLGTLNSTSDAGGPGYEDDYCSVVNGKTTHLSRILTELTDVTINLPVLKTHGVSGVTGAMKNIYGVIDNPADFHEDLNSSLPALYALTPVQSRFRLTIVDALIAVCVGGTSSPTDTVPKRLLASADPVAVDAYALALVNDLRAAKTPAQPPVDSKYTGWIDTAASQGLGLAAYNLKTIAR